MSSEVDIEEIVWAPMPLESESNRISALIEDSYADALNKDLTEQFISEVIRRANSNQNLVLSIFGEPGSGKSYQAIFIASFIGDLLNKVFRVDNVYFEIAYLLDRLENAEERNEVFLDDEQTKNFGLGSGIERENLSNVEEIIRKHKCFLIFCCPHFVSHEHHYFLETWERGLIGGKWVKRDEVLAEDVFRIDVIAEIDGVQMAYVGGKWKYTKSILYDSKDQRLGYIVTETPSDQALLDAYEAKKDEFIIKKRERKGDARTDRLLKIAEEVANDPDFEERTSLDTRMMFIMERYGSLGTGQVKMIARRAMELSKSKYRKRIEETRKALFESSDSKNEENKSEI